MAEIDFAAFYHRYICGKSIVTTLKTMQSLLDVLLRNYVGARENIFVLLERSVY